MTSLTSEVLKLPGFELNGETTDGLCLKYRWTDNGARLGAILGQKIGFSVSRQTTQQQPKTLQSELLKSFLGFDFQNARTDWPH